MDEHVCTYMYTKTTLLSGHPHLCAALCARRLDVASLLILLKLLQKAECDDLRSLLRHVSAKCENVPAPLHAVTPQSLQNIGMQGSLLTWSAG